MVDDDDEKKRRHHHNIRPGLVSGYSREASKQAPHRINDKHANHHEKYIR
jgi:hypothetical protein